MCFHAPSILHQCSIDVVLDWLSVFDEGFEICHFFDVQKTFDSVPRIPLIQKLADINFNPHILNILQNYLTHIVVLEGSSTLTKPLRCTPRFRPQPPFL